MHRSGRKELVGPRKAVTAEALGCGMRGRRLAVAVTVVLAIVVLGSATTVLIAARSQQEKAAEPQVLSQEVPPKKGSADVADTAALGAADADLVDLKTGSAIRTSSKPTPKPTPVITPAPGKSVQQESVSRDTSRVRSTDAGKRESTQGTVYTWYDGDRTMRAVLQNDLGVQKTSANSESDEVVVAKGQDSIVRKQSSQGSDVQPVFKPESGEGLMTLPGGVLLALEPGWDDAQVKKFFAGNDIAEDRLTELDFLDNGFLVSTEPGFPALELANALAHQDGVVSASPNWSREREPR